MDLDVFETELGWFGIGGRDGRLCAVWPAYPSRQAVLGHVERQRGPKWRVRLWAPKLRKQMCLYAAGGTVCFDSVPLDLSGFSLFRRRVMSACAAISYGDTQTYSELAEAAGYPLAVRAAGSVMASNPMPIVVPCHRVVRKDGGLGGYSAPPGIALKRRLLEMESQVTLPVHS